MKKICIGIIIGIVISISTIVFVENKNIEAFFNNIKIQINGKTITNMDVEPFIYQGRTFVPVRFIAENFGAIVKWNETDNIVEIESELFINLEEEEENPGFGNFPRAKPLN